MANYTLTIKCESHIHYAYSVWRFYWWRKLKYPKKTTNLPKVTDKLYHIMLYWVFFTWAGFELAMLVVIGTDSIGRPPFSWPHLSMTWKLVSCKRHKLLISLYINLNGQLYINYQMWKPHPLWCCIEYSSPERDLNSLC
jgi:hypothetical protein